MLNTEYCSVNPLQGTDWDRENIVLGSPAQEAKRKCNTE